MAVCKANMSSFHFHFDQSHHFHQSAIHGPMSPLAPPLISPSPGPLTSPPLPDSGPKAPRSLNFFNSNAFMRRMMIWASLDDMQKREKEHLNSVSVVTQVVYLPVSVSLSCGFTPVSLLLIAHACIQISHWYNVEE